MHEIRKAYMKHGYLDNFSKLLNLFFASSNVAVSHIWLLLYLCKDINYSMLLHRSHKQHIHIT